MLGGQVRGAVESGGDPGSDNPAAPATGFSAVPDPGNGAVLDLGERDWFPAVEDEALVLEVAAALDREPALVVPDVGEPFMMVRGEDGGWMPTVAGVAGGPGLVDALGRVAMPGRSGRFGPGIAGAGRPAGADVAALGHGVGLDVSGVSDAELGEVAAGCQRLMSWARALQAAAITELSHRPDMAPEPSSERFGSVSARSCTALELTDPLQVTSGQVEQLVAESVQLVEDFPATHAALAVGRIDERRARVILGELGRQDRDVAQVVESAVIDRAAGMNARQLRRKVKDLVHKLAPVAAEERRRKAERDRFVRVSPAEDGMAWLEALLRAEDAIALQAVLDAGQKTLKRRDGQAGDANARTADQRRADVLAHLAWAALAAGRIGPDGPECPPDASGDSDTDGAGDADADGAGAPAPDASHAATGEPASDTTGESVSTAASGAISGESASEPASDATSSDAASGEPVPDTSRDTAAGEPVPGVSGGSGDLSGDRPVNAGCRHCGAGGSPFGDPGGSPVGTPGGLSLSGAHRRPVTVQVTVPLSTLIGLDDQPGYLAGYGPVPADVARHLSVAGVWQWVGTDDVNGTVLSHGRTRYVPTRDLVDHVILRDRACKAPGCDAAAQVCDLDHTIYFPLGSTTACNLGLFCRKHHLLKHRPRWRVTQPEPGLFRWISPTGRVVTLEPTPVGPVPDPAPRADHDPPDPPEAPGAPHATPESGPPPGPTTDPPGAAAATPEPDRPPTRQPQPPPDDPTPEHRPNPDDEPPPF